MTSNRVERQIRVPKRPQQKNMISPGPRLKCLPPVPPGSTWNSADRRFWTNLEIQAAECKQTKARHMTPPQGIHKSADRAFVHLATDFVIDLHFVVFGVFSLPLRPTRLRSNCFVFGFLPPPREGGGGIYQFIFRDVCPVR